MSDAESSGTTECSVCGEEFEGEASLEGHRLSVHGENMSDSNSDTQTDETDAQTTDAPPIYHHGGHLFTVYSGKQSGESNEQNAYQVNLSPEHPTCTCEHGVHHTTSTRACWHIREAIKAGPTRLSPEEGSQRHLYQLTNRALELIDELEGGVSEASAGTESQDESPDVDPQEARETLQSAFDEAMSEGAFDTMVSDGKIWINKTPDAPDWTFDAFLSDPDSVWYEPDDAPEDYYKNSILPENVDQYVTEVIE